jgi:hypothetical protein
MDCPSVSSPGGAELGISGLLGTMAPFSGDFRPREETGEREVKIFTDHLVFINNNRVRIEEL